MSLLVATLLAALALLLLGSFFLANRPGFKRRALSLLRSDPAALVVLAVASAWFLYKVTQWGDADFGDYRHIAFVLFLSVAILSWIFLKDFLIVRAGAILALMVAHSGLAAAYMHYDQPGRLFLVSLIYVVIVFSLFLGAVPYRMRDLLEWVFGNATRSRAFGAAFAVYGLILCGAALSY